MRASIVASTSAATPRESMSRKPNETESPADTLKNESARQRWELFHRAIAHAKASNDAALDDTDASTGDSKGHGPLLSIVR